MNRRTTFGEHSIASLHTSRSDEGSANVRRYPEKGLKVENEPLSHTRIRLAWRLISVVERTGVSGRVAGTLG